MTTTIDRRKATGRYQIVVFLSSFTGAKVNMRTVCAVGISAAFVAFLAWVLVRNVGDIQMLARSFDARFLAVAFAAQTGALFVAAVTWHRMIASLGRDGDSRRNVGIYVTTAFARRLPGSLWGPALRIYWYRRLGGDWRAVGAASVLEVWATSVAGILLAVAGITLFIGAASLTLWVGVAVGVILLGATCVPSVNRWGLQQVLRIARPFSEATSTVPDSRELARWVGLELVNWLLGGIELAAVLRAITPYDGWRLPSIIGAWPIAGTGGALITFLPGGFGVVEFVLVSLLGSWLPLSTALLTALGLRVFATATELVWMIVGFAGTAFLRSRQIKTS